MIETIMATQLPTCSSICLVIFMTDNELNQTCFLLRLRVWDQGVQVLWAKMWGARGGFAGVEFEIQGYCLGLTMTSPHETVFSHPPVGSTLVASCSDECSVLIV